MADGSLPQAKPVAHIIFKCCDCETPTNLCDLNDDMQCEACGPVDLDPEDFAPSESELRVSERTFSI